MTSFLTSLVCFFNVRSSFIVKITKIAHKQFSFDSSFDSEKIFHLVLMKIIEFFLDLYWCCLVGDRVVIRRRCVYANVNDAKDACMHEQVSRSIQREFCEVCDTDGCNGGAQYGPAILFVIVSAAVTKFLSS